MSHKFVRLLFCTALIVVVLFSTPTRATSFSVPDLMSAARSIDCLDWRITGLCFWLRCTVFGCRVVSSIRVAHRLPDLVVQSYHETNKPPWREWRSLIGTSQHLGGGMAGSITSQATQNTLHFYETDVIGNPAADLADKFPGKFLCKSDADPMKPYYVSINDHKLWRGALAAKALGEPREVGQSRWNTWGPLEPRIGFVLQSHSTKAAAVCAARGADIVTRDAGDHIAEPYVGGDDTARSVLRGNTSAPNRNACEQSGGNWQEPKGVGECRRSIWRQWRIAHDSLSDNWQMLIPKKKQDCTAFGIESAPSTAADGQYAWQWWQEYRCCRKRGIYLGRIGE